MHPVGKMKRCLYVTTGDIYILYNSGIQPGVREDILGGT
jgi:hypothetical protein